MTDTGPPTDEHRPPVTGSGAVVELGGSDERTTSWDAISAAGTGRLKIRLTDGSLIDDGDLPALARSWAESALTPGEEPGVFEGDCPACDGHDQIGWYPEGGLICACGCTDLEILRAVDVAVGPADWPDPQPLNVLPPADLPRPQREPKRLTTVSLAELFERKPDPWLVDGLIPAGAEGRLVTLAGASNAGKTFALLDLALSVACGVGSWLDRPCRTGPVVYIPLEGVFDVRARARAWLTAHDLPVPGEDRFRVVEVDGLALDNGEDVAALAATISAGSDVLVVVDTLSDALGGVDEDRASQMRPVMRAVRSVLKQTGVTMVLAQHTPWTGGRERGSNAVRGAADTTLLLHEADAHGRQKITVEKQRSARKGGPLLFELQDVPGSGSAVVRPVSAFALAADAEADDRIMRRQILDTLAAEPGLNKTRVRAVVTGNNTLIGRAVDAMVEDGELLRKGSALYTPGPFQEAA